MKCHLGQHSRASEYVDARPAGGMACDKGKLVLAVCGGVLVGGGEWLGGMATTLLWSGSSGGRVGAEEEEPRVSQARRYLTGGGREGRRGPG